MDREDIIEILKSILDWYEGHHTVNAFQAKRGFNYFKDIIEYLNNEINLERLLQWEEDVEYIDPQTDEIYKISNNNLYKHVEGQWIESYDILFTGNHINRIRKFNQVDSLNSKTKYFWKVPLVEKGYLNYSKDKEVYTLSDNSIVEKFQTTFTEDEIKEIERRHDVDLSFLEKEPIERK